MKELKRCVLELLRQADVDEAEVSVTLIDDDHIRHLNKTYRHIDRYTDVLAFELTDPPDSILVGDIYISMERVIHQAGSHSVSRREELLRLLVHGVLHLCGYRDDISDSEEAMIKRQEAMVRGFLSGEL